MSLEKKRSIVSKNSRNKSHSTDLDVHKQKYVARKELERKEAQLKLIMDASPIAIVYLDKHERCKFANAFYEANYGQATGSIQGKTARELIGEEAYSQISPYVKQALSGRAVSFEMTVQRQAAAPITVAATYVPDIDSQGQLRGIVALTQDISERKKIENDNAILLEKFQEALKKAEEANRIKSEFLVNMSHEIRTPISAILGFTQIINEATTDLSTRMKCAEIITRNCQRLSSLISDILDMSMVEAGKLDLDQKPLYLSSVLSELVRVLGPDVERKGLQLSISPIPTFVPDRIYSDSVRLYQVLSNLLLNAIKFTVQGHIKIELSTCYEGPDLKILFRVIDSGIGISPEKCRHLFKAFSQLDTSLTREFGGTGLGLALSKRLCNMMGGDLVLEKSEPGGGSTFLASINANLQLLEQKYPLLLSDQSPSAGDSSSGSLLGIKILVVEDSPDIQALIKFYLESDGATVEVANNGLEALNLALKNEFHIVLMDIQMPVLDGYKATKKLREFGFKKPIIALTAHALHEEQERSIREGCNVHITKPINHHFLTSIINTLLYQSA